MTEMTKDSLIADESQIFTLDPEQIKVHEDLPRVRKEMGKVEELLESINKFGQMQPVVINRNFELIAGGRRLAACTLGKRKVRVCFSDVVDPLIMRELELEENLQRKALTPAEELAAVSEIHELKTKIYGEPRRGVPGGGTGWTMEDTANLTGKSRQSVVDDLILAQAIKEFPGLADFKTKNDIRKAVKSMEKMMQRVDAVVKYEKEIEGSNYPVTLIEGDSLEHMKSVPTGSVDVLLTDPPYGIDIDVNALGIGNITGGVTTAGYGYQDDTEYMMQCINVLATESIRFCKEDAHAYIFVGPEHFTLISLILKAAGWHVHVRPLIWIKNASGQNNAPHCWPSSAYEMVLYARRASSRLILEGRVDWFQFSPVTSSERLHQAEKPVGLMKELLNRSALPGATVYDPFMGSGPTIEAALELQMIPTGVEKLREAYASATMRVERWIKNQQ